MVLQPTLATSRLVLRPRTLADTEACLEMDRAPGVTRYLDGPWDDPVAHRAFIEARTAGPYADGLGYWTVTAREAPEAFLGWVLLIPNDAVGPEIEIGWRFHPDHWGRGYATEAARAVLDHGFATVGLAGIIAEIDLENTASVAVAEKIGLRRGKAWTRDGRTWVRYSLGQDA